LHKISTQGGRRLEGEVCLSGSKNATVAILAGALLPTTGKIVLKNVPRISDVVTLLEILQYLGVGVDFTGNVVTLDSTSLATSEAPYELIRKMRASFGVLGPLLARFGHARLWAEVWADGLRMVAEARFGDHGLPPDWLSISHQTGALSPAAGWPARFSYDAVRIPLHLAWARVCPPGFADAVNAYWSPGSPTFGAAWVDLQSGEVAGYPPSAGLRAVQHRWLSYQGIDPAPLTEPALGGASDYFSSALVLLSHIAREPTGGGADRTSGRRT